MKAKVWAPVNIALIKYWGKEDEELRIPANANLSVCLKNLGTETELEWVRNLKEDMVMIDGKMAKGRERERVVKQLDRIRKMAEIKLRARVVSKNNFPKSTGLSSSASGMAALSLSGCKSAGLDLSEKELSILARKASGSACRSIPDGWVEWVKGKDDKSSYAKKIFPVDWWDLRVLVVILSKDKKRISTTKGHKLAKTSLFYEKRMKRIRKDLRCVKEYIKKRDFEKFGEMLETESMSIHGVMLTSKPSLIYWLPETVRVMYEIRDWRRKGLESYFTVNTGQNVFVFCEPENEDRLVKKLGKVEGVLEVKRDRIGGGVRIA